MTAFLDSENQVSLASQLALLKEVLAGRATPERIEAIDSATARLRASGIEAAARGVGDSAPDVTLPDALGRPVRLADLWTDGPLVLVFYRGGWCPYCNLELRAWQKLQPLLRQTGGHLAAVSPQQPDGSLSTAERAALDFPVLSDPTLEAASGFGVAFDLPPELVALYQDMGIDLPVINGNGRWALPVPATYVIGRDGRIHYAHVDVDYRRRAEPADVLHALQSLAATRA